MKTLTELSGLVIRAAAAALAQARQSLPKDEAPEKPPTTEPSVPVTGEAAPAEAPAPTAPPAAAAPAAATPAAGESEAVKAALDAAVAGATGFSGDRLTMLRGAVEAVGGRAGDVRLVRVVGLDEQVAGAAKVGAYQYLVDLYPRSMKQVAESPKDRGSRGGGGGGRGGGGRGGGGRGAPAGTTGGFSMDSLREDRKGGRGRSGEGRGPGGGGKPGAPPRGPPKK